MVLIYALFGALLIAYLALGTAQAFAITAGLMQRGYGPWPARVVALLLAFLPVVGNAAAVRGAMVGWGWTMGKGWSASSDRSPPSWLLCFSGDGAAHEKPDPDSPETRPTWPPPAGRKPEVGLKSDDMR